MTGSRMGAVLRQVDTLLREGTVSGLSDRELIDRFRERSGRSESAFSGLVERHGPMVLGVCRSILRDPNDIDDAFQATFLILVRRAGSLWVRDSIGPWLHGVAGRVALRALRDADRRRTVEERAGLRETVPEHPPERAEAVRLVHEELIALPERWRAPLVLCHLEGLTHEQASRSLGVPVGTVRSRLSRGRERLRDRLIRRGLTPSLAALAASGLNLGGEGSAAIVSASLVHKTVSAGLGLASGWSLAGPMTASISVATYQLTQGVLMTMFLANAKTAAMVLAVGLGGGTLAVTLNAGGAGPAATAPAAAAKADTPIPRPDPVAPGGPPRPVDGPAVPPLDHSRRPLLSTVQIEVTGAKNTGFATGTVISSTVEETIILTCGHVFKLDGIPQHKPALFPKRTLVNLFSEELPTAKTKEGPPKLHFTGGVEGEVVDYDFEHDLGLVRISQDRHLTVSPIVPPNRKVRDKMQVLAVGCTQGYPPTAGPATLLGVDEQSLFDKFRVEGILGTHHNLGRAGGGLFTNDGCLFGVSTASAPSDNNGTYATPNSIHAFLDRNGLKHLYMPKEPAASPKPASDSALLDPSSVSVPPRPADEPEFTELNPEADKPPKPWKTAARIRILGPGAVGFGSGTVISSTPEESIVLTCGHIFRLDQNPQPEPTAIRWKIQVDLFDGDLKGTRPAHVTFSEAFEGTLVDCDFQRDVALVRFKPGRQLPASPIVPPRWTPAERMPMLTVGCSEGRDATVWATRIVETLTRGLSGNPDYEAIVCQTAMQQGRSGGGLFTDDGYLAGVSNFSDDKANRGLYATPNSIRQILGRSGLKHLYQPKPPANEFRVTLQDDQTPKTPVQAFKSWISDSPMDLGSPETVKWLQTLHKDLTQRQQNLKAELQTVQKEMQEVLGLLNKAELMRLKKAGDSAPGPADVVVDLAFPLGDLPPIAARKPSPFEDEGLTKEAEQMSPFELPRDQPKKPRTPDVEGRLKDVEQKLERMLRLLEKTPAAR